MNFREWIVDFMGNTKSSNDKDVDTVVGEIKAEIYYKELALYTAITLIANAISKCEIKTYKNNKEVKEQLYYTLNISPNANQNSSQLWHKVIEKMVYDEKALVLDINDKLYCADSFSTDPNPILGDKYNGIRIDTLNLNHTFKSKEVLLLKLDDIHLKKLIDGLYEQYGLLLSYAIKSFKKSNSIKYKLKMSNIKAGDEKFNRLFEEVIKKQLELLEIETLLNKPYDSCNAILEIHSGAGGTEACDWAEMLYRMYQRWCEKKGYKIEVTDMQQGDEAGIKSLTAIVKGINAYGYLKNEKGIHRLVRISPFDSNSRRHTSFAGIDVTPLFDNEKIDIEIKPSDIRVDVYRSSGCGGQGVNTTDSAVRITHIPTKIVVTCQNERSQIQNKEKAMEVLMSKLYKLEIEKRNNELKNIKGSLDDINFGSQIRSYIMCPYTLVKDHRTNVEVTNVNSVLDGNIDVFINSILKEG